MARFSYYIGSAALLGVTKVKLSQVAFEVAIITKKLI